MGHMWRGYGRSMPLPRVIARLNKRFTNRLIEPLVARTASFAIVEHHGRRSGKLYRTPVNLFACDGDFVVALTYGPGADWVRNVMAGPSACERSGVRYTIETAELAPRGDVWHCLPAAVRVALRILRVHHFCRVYLSGVVASL